jgi:hypothetical protein
MMQILQRNLRPCDTSGAGRLQSTRRLLHDGHGHFLIVFDSIRLWTWNEQRKRLSSGLTFG